MSVVVEGARKHFRSRRGGRVVALDGVDLTARPGELLVVVGPSGSGKSTLLRAVAGLAPLDEGRVLIDDRDVTRVPAGRRDVAMVFQEAALFPHLGVAANIGIGERARGSGRRAVEAGVRAVARTLDLEHLLTRMPNELSGGERQRVALARAMIRAPRVFLLDEPLAAVDAEARLRLRGEIRAVQRALGVPTVHVTHDQTEAMAVGDRVAVMAAGRVLQCDTPAELYAHPATTAVARAFGPLPMNLLPAAGGIVVGVRPERLRVRPDGTGFGTRTGAGAGTVVAVEPAGEECLVRIAHDGPPSNPPTRNGSTDGVLAWHGVPAELSAGDGSAGGQVVRGGSVGELLVPEGSAGELLARVPWADAPRPGERVILTWRPEDEHHFDAVTGVRR